MEDDLWLAEQFDSRRAHLRSVAYRILGSSSEADDAVQGTWLRLSRADASTIDNLGGWLTTAVARECLDILRSRRSRREQSLDVLIIDPVGDGAANDPEHQALVADSVGLAMLMVLEAMTPSERVAFVLHDVFAVPHEEIAPILGRTPVATRQLASRARRKVQGEAVKVDAGCPDHQELVHAFLAAARDGDFEALIELLHPDVVARGALGPFSRQVQGPEKVAREALGYARRLARYARPAVVDGRMAIVVVGPAGPVAVLTFEVRESRIGVIDIRADWRRLRDLYLPADD